VIYHQEDPVNTTASPQIDRHLRRITLRVAIALTGATILASTAAGTAYASVTAKHGTDEAHATTNHLRAYDGERDGNGVYADAYLVDGQHISIWDGNGADGSPGPWANVGGTISKFRVCEDHVGCSGWRYNPA